MMIASKNSKKRLLHMPGCGYARRIRPEHQLRFDSFASGVRAGWHMCPPLFLRCRRFPAGTHPVGRKV